MVAENNDASSAQSAAETDLLAGLLHALPGWQHDDVQHAAADDRDALILAVGRVAHALPPGPTVLSVTLGRQGGLAMGSTRLAVVGADDTELVAVQVQDLALTGYGAVALAIRLRRSYGRRQPPLPPLPCRCTQTVTDWSLMGLSCWRLTRR